jgi:hypothetical protein
MSTISPEIGGAVPETNRAVLALAGLGALGVVFGDIGTSPLYTLKTAFGFLHGDATPDRILGILSLVVWTLFLVTSIKYVVVAMSIDNDSEGGILALMSLLGVQRHRRLAFWRHCSWPAAGYLTDRYRIRSHYACLVCCNRSARVVGDRARPVGVVRNQPLLWASLS